MATKKAKSPEQVKEEILKRYPPKVARKRAKQYMVHEGAEAMQGKEISANVRTIPGIITQRGCTYAGCKGVILGPTRDIVNITHGPIGCGFYSWLTRRNQTDTSDPEAENYMMYSFSTDMNENDIVFGGEKKLSQAVQEAYDMFKPTAIAIFSTCPVGLIGDDVHAVARDMKAKLNEGKPESEHINVFAFSCEGYKGVSQSAGHHIANNEIFKHVVGTNMKKPEGQFIINMLGEYNIGGDAFEIDRIAEKCGIKINATFSGNSTYDDFARAPTADLNCVMCHRSINYVADMMEVKYGIPWIKVNFIGAEATAQSLRKIAQYFGDKTLIDRVEEVIAEELAEVKKVYDDILPRTTGKTAMLFVGGSRAHHYQELFKELGMRPIGAGYEFAHRDDYEGRHVIPDIKIDADSRNIEELEVEACPTDYNPRKTEDELQKLEAAGFEFKDYAGMIPDMEKDSLVIDDINAYETEKLIEIMKPDIFCAGIKEKYSVEKMGIPMKQLHNYDIGGPYAGFVGAINWAKDIDRMVSSKLWDYMQAPWDKEPQLAGTYVK